MDNCGEPCKTFGILYCGLNLEQIAALKKKGIKECPIIHGMFENVGKSLQGGQDVH